MKKANIIISVILIAFCVFFGVLTARLPDRNLPNTLGIDFMPWVLLIILLCLSVMLLIINILGKSRERKDAAITLREVSGVFFLTLIVYGYVQAMSLLGFLIITPVFIAVLMLLTGSRKWKELVAVSILATFGVYFFFQKIFQVQLPGGSLF
jgi:hypothetical protein